jgi:PleD family two-component response regulator
MSGEVLRGIAQILRTKCAATSSQPAFGGEEFTFVLPETDLSGAIALGASAKP